MSALLQPRQILRKGRLPDDGRKIVLQDISWQAYQAIGEALRDRPIFMTYDRGTLEIMTLSTDHERFKGKLGRLVSILARHLRKNFESFGSFTQKREDLLKGVEADDCFYIDSLPAVLGKKNIDLERDPAPDLALEIDVKHSSLDRMSIYAALKIPEVWRFDGKSVTVWVLIQGQYEAREFSPTFPGIPIAELSRFIFLGLEQGEMVMWETFEKWLGKLPGTRKKPARKKKK